MIQVKTKRNMYDIYNINIIERGDNLVVYATRFDKLADNAGLFRVEVHLYDQKGNVVQLEHVLDLSFDDLRTEITYDEKYWDGKQHSIKMNTFPLGNRLYTFKKIG